MNNDAMFKLTYGLFVLTANDGTRDNGCIINTVSQVTDSPNRITATVSKSNFTHDMIMKSGKFNVSVLSEKSQFETYKHWGFQSGQEVDKLVGIEYKRSENGLIYLINEVNSFISAKVIDSVDLGSHTMFIAQVTNCEILNDADSVTYNYYHKHIKPAFNEQKKKGYICMVCGYVYEGAELPKDFICPWCKHDVSAFKPME